MMVAANGRVLACAPGIRSANDGHSTRWGEPVIELPCLSVTQPWADMICAGPKDVENRSWSTKFRGSFLVHAGKTMSAAAYEDACEFALTCGVKRRALPALATLGRGGIVGAAQLLDMLPPGDLDHVWHSKPEPGQTWKPQFGLLLAHRMTLPFRALRGALGLFKVKLTKGEEEALRAAGRLPLGALASTSH
jgi:hypothetical protein